MDIEMFFSFVKMVFVLILVILIANVSLKFLNTKINSQSRMIRILEKVNVDAHSSIGIVEIMSNYYLMSFTEKENNILKELSKDQVEEYLAKFENEVSYKKKIDFSKLTKRYKGE